MERREHRRLRFWLPLQLEVEGTGEKIEEGMAVSHDASDGGFLLVCSQRCPVGAPIHLTFSIPPGGPLTVRVGATVVRVSSNDEDPDGLWPYKVAVQFDEPVPDLEAYLEHVHAPALTEENS
jgi:hypothetical protein